jgi:hypothetical protein
VLLIICVRSHLLIEYFFIWLCVSSVYLLLDIIFLLRIFVLCRLEIFFSSHLQVAVSWLFELVDDLYVCLSIKWL